MSLRADKRVCLKESVVTIHSELIEQARKGEQSAFRKLYSLYSRAMYNTALRIVVDRGDAEDILQESFLRAFENLHQYRGESSFGSWLKRIVVNRSLNVLRSRFTFESADEIELSTEEETANEHFGFPFSVNQVNESIKKLADGYRTVLTLYLIEGYDHSEIGEILGIDENTSKSQLSRAKRKLIEILRENFKQNE